MLYFVPAWYKENSWNEFEQYWHRRRSKSEFDDIIKQIQHFHRHVSTDYQIVALHYAPNFRHFLHRQGLFRVTYWSCFDAIAQVRRKKVAVLSFNNIKWPEGVEFVYSPFAIVVYLHGEKYAVIDFGENGNPISIDMFENGKICRRNLYDDRGFISSTEVFEDGVFSYKDYLMENGIRKMRMFAEDGHIEINPKVPCYDIDFGGEIHEFPFERTRYNSMDEIVQEVLSKYASFVSEDDSYFIAVHPKHMRVVDNSIKTNNIVATFFEDRFPINRLDENKSFFARTKYIVTDTLVKRQELEAHLSDIDCRIKDISPYDTRMDFGISGQLKVQNILLPVDGLSNELFRKTIVELAGYMKMNEKAVVHMFTRNVEWGSQERLLENVAEILGSIGSEPQWAVPVMEMQVNGEMGNELDEITVVEQRFFVDSCIDERTISKLINEQRVILDLRRVEDVFLDVTAISKGVPRIGLSEDKYLVDKKNGMIIKDETEIIESMKFYLDNFENWNAALVGCYEVGQRYTTDVLIAAWREVLDSIG